MPEGQPLHIPKSGEPGYPTEEEMRTCMFFGAGFCGGGHGCYVFEILNLQQTDQEPGRLREAAGNFYTQATTVGAPCAQALAHIANPGQ